MAISCSQAKAWVKTHYERHEEGVVAKSVMYKHYEDFCREQGRNIMETSIFGRVVKNVFPDVTIRRLGGRDNLKYYYCGIRAKETSPYAIDNATTTRPKRRLRKRELVTDKTEVHNCLRWLHAHFYACTDCSVVKTEVYDTYLSHCSSRGAEPLSAQYFGMVVTHAFPNVTKRKLGPRTNQQKYYFGIQERVNPMSLELVPTDILSSVEEVLKNGNKSSYREVENDNVDEEEEDEYPCRSPESDMSDMVSQSFHSTGYETEMQSSPHLHHHHQYHQFEPFLKVEETEPVDYSLSALKLKDEPNDEDELMIKEEPLDLHIERDIVERRTPDRPPSAGTFVSSHSPSPPSKDVRSRKIYKPRFHYETSWNEELIEEKQSDNSGHFYEETQSALALKDWIFFNIEEAKGVHTNRDQLMTNYEKYCSTISISSLPMTYFDETMLKLFQGVVTMIHPSGRTYYEGVRVKKSSPLYSEIQELYQDESTWTEDESSQHAMELSVIDESPPHSSLLTLEDEDDPPDEGYSFQQIEEDMQSTPEVLRDGKFYLRKWLTDNFDSVPDSCVLKADAYRHYDTFARNIHQTPFEMNVFGKIVRQVFPKVSIRRLGGRLKPQYHYCGIAVKPTSPLCQVMSGKDPAQRSRKKEIATDNRSAEIVIEFLRRNYEAAKDRATTKSEVFETYSTFCNSINENPITLNYFGKLVKHCFPNVEVRKFGGRTEPTWFYFGMCPIGGISYSRYGNSLSQMSSSPSYTDENTTKEVMGAGFCTNTSVVLDICRHSTSPIPISVGQRGSGNSLGHFQGSSPSLINSRLHSSSARVYDNTPPTQGGSSPVEVTSYYRDPISIPAAELFYSRSPVESHSQGQLYTPSQIEFPRETFHHPHRIHLAGGQVVPSQTPPNLLVTQSSDHSMGLMVSKKAKRPFSNHDEYEMLQDIGME